MLFSKTGFVLTAKKFSWNLKLIKMLIGLDVIMKIAQDGLTLSVRLKRVILILKIELTIYPTNTNVPLVEIKIVKPFKENPIKNLQKL